MFLIRSAFRSRKDLIAASKLFPIPPQGCEECPRIGSGWIHLRLCLECDHVGYCDLSPHRHAIKNFHHYRQPVMRSFEPGETWGWSCIDRIIQLFDLP